MTKKVFESANVVAKIEGSDPKLKHEYLVLSAHIDGLGLGEPTEPGDGDRIYNGALDNASGCAVLLDIAAHLQKEVTRPRRSLLFVFFTGEETGPMGNVGSKYFVARPSVDANAIIGNVNVDEVHAIVPLKALVVLGLDDSDMGDAARRVAASQNIPIDFEDSRLRSRRFIFHSDQYSFSDAEFRLSNSWLGSPAT